MYLGFGLLIGGFLLCISIAWAALGFFLMGLGLICLLSAEERKKRSRKLTTSLLDEPNNRKGPHLFPEPTVALVSSGLPSIPISHSFDEEKWKSLVENDPELSSLVNILVSYGQKYVDELARAYLVLNDKDYLPMIIKKIVKSARKDAGQDFTSELMVVSNPNAEAVAAKTRRSRQDRARLQAVYEVVADSPVLMSTTPRMDPDTKSPLPAQSTRGVLPGGASAADGREPELEKADADKIANVAAPESAKEVARAVHPDTDDDLADLLSSLDLKATSRTKR